MKDGMFRLGRWVALAMACAVTGTGSVWAQPEEKPAWDYEIEESAVARYVGVDWHKKDYGWLFTCHFGVTSRNVIAPISHIVFEGMNEEEEVIWEKRQVVRQKDFEGAFKGGSAQFVRAMLKDIPDEVVMVKIRYETGLEEEE